MSNITVERTAGSEDAAHEHRAGDVVAQLARERNLSDRERDVLARTACGESTKQIAYVLGISLNTVAYFWARIFHKLGCRSQIEVMSLLFRRASAPPESAERGPR